MQNINLSKTNILLAVLLVVTFVLLPVNYFWGTTGMELLQLEEDYLMMPGLLLWVFFIGRLIAVITAFFERYDFAVFASICGACGVVLSTLLRLIDYGDGNFMDHMGTALVYCIIAIAEVVICIKKKNEY